MLGAASLSWDDLESIVTLLEGPMPKTWRIDQAISASELPFSRINRIRLRHQRVIETPISPNDVDAQFDSDLYAEPESLVDDHHGDDPQLLDLLLMSRSLGATDPRDKIYALLGLGKRMYTAEHKGVLSHVATTWSLDPVQDFDSLGTAADSLAHRF